MKIGQPSDKPVPANTAAPAPSVKDGPSASTKAAANANSSSAPAQGSASAGVAVTVSTLARTLSARQSGETADVDAKKVEAVRFAIQQGTYKVNAEAIADKLLANAQEILKRSRD